MLAEEARAAAGHAGAIDAAAATTPIVGCHVEYFGQAMPFDKMVIAVWEVERGLVAAQAAVGGEVVSTVYFELAGGTASL